MIPTLFRFLRRIPKLKRWYDDQINKYTFGAFPTPDKLWRQLRQDLMMVIKEQVRRMVFEGKRAKFLVDANRLPHIKLFRKFIITLVDMPQSVQSAQHCIESARRQGEEQHLEIMPAVDKFHSEAFFKKHGFIWDTRSSVVTDDFAGMGCFASHYKLWFYCVETGTPLVVLEHDVEFVQSIPALRFRDVAILSAVGEGDSAAISPLMPEVPYIRNHLYGTHAYAITPEGARKLIVQAQQQFVPPVDWFMDKRCGIDIISCVAPPLQLVSSFSSIATWNKDKHGE